MKFLAATLATPLLLLAATSPARAAEPAAGFYLGASITQSRFNDFEFDEIDDIDDEDTGWKAIVGYRFGPYLGLEGSYIDFGQAKAPSVPVSGPINAEAKGFALFGVGLLPIGPFDLFAKAGAARIDSEGNVGAVFYEDDATEFAWGLGAQWRLAQLAIRAEYESFDTDVIGDLGTISVGLTYTFAAN